MSDMAANAPREPFPFKAKMQRPSNSELYRFADHHFRAFNPGYPDFYREAEWEREFDQYASAGNLPSFELLELGTDHMGNFDTATAGVDTRNAKHLTITRPMTEVFDLNQKDWGFEATPSAVLANTQLPLSPAACGMALDAAPAKTTHPAQYLGAEDQSFNCRQEDRLDADAFNRIIWEGLMNSPYPTR